MHKRFTHAEVVVTPRLTHNTLWSVCSTPVVVCTFSMTSVRLCSLSADLASASTDGTVTVVAPLHVPACIRRLGLVPLLELVSTVFTVYSTGLVGAPAQLGGKTFVRQ